MNRNVVGSIYGRPSMKIANLSNLYREPAIYASYQLRFIWPSGFRGEDFCRNRPITLKRNYESVFLTQNYEQIAHLVLIP
jgi:hypothetical protein